MDLWSPPGIGQNPVTVPGDAGPEKAKLHDLFPLTPQAGSVGGHDTERAIVEMTQRLKDDHRAVLVLLTNTAASINSPGARVIGANDPRYRSALQSWRRVAQVNESGASLVLPVTMTRPGDRPVTRIIDAVILVPASFVGSPISSGTRSQRAGRSETPLRPIPSRAELRQPLQFDLRWLLLPGIGVLVAVVIWLIQPRGGLLLEVEGSTFDLATIRDGDEICHLAGPGYPSPNPRTISITSPGAPPERIARFFKERGAAVLVRGDRLKLRSVDGAVVDNCKRLGDEGLHTLVFRGEVHHHPALPSQMVQIQVRTHLKRAPHPGKEA